MLGFSGALRFDLCTDFVSSVDHYDIGNWLGLRQDLYSSSSCRDQHWSEERDCLRCPWWRGWYDDLPEGPTAGVSDTGEEMGHERLLLRLRGASRSKVGLVLTGGCGLPMETCGKKT